MEGFNPVMLLINVPLPVPSEVWGPVATGPEEVLQHTPRAETAAPPLFVMSPPDIALVLVGEVMAAVVSVGVTGDAVKDTSLP